MLRSSKHRKITCTPHIHANPLSHRHQQIQMARSCPRWGAGAKTKATASCPALEDGSEEGMTNTNHDQGGQLVTMKPCLYIPSCYFPSIFHPLSRTLLRAILRGRKAGIYLHLACEETKSWDSEVICSRSGRDHRFLKLEGFLVVRRQGKGD